MTATLISLISIAIGIISANLTGFFYKKKSLGLIGNSISGVFGSIFFMKLIAKCNLNIQNIIINHKFDITLFIIIIAISIFGGCISVIVLSKLKKRMNLE